MPCHFLPSLDQDTKNALLFYCTLSSSVLFQAKHPLSSLCEMFLKNSNLTCVIPPLLLVKTQLQKWIEKTFPAIVVLCFVLLNIKIDTLLIWHSLMWCSKYFYNNSNRSITIMVAVSVINYFSK